MSTLHRQVRPLLLGIVVASTLGIAPAALFAGAPVKKKPLRAPQSMYEDAIDQQKPAVVECVMNLGINRGAPSVELNIKALINGSGRLFGCAVTVTQVGGDPKGMKECVEKALYAAKFPTSVNQFTELRRQWIFKSQ